MDRFVGGMVTVTSSPGIDGFIDPPCAFVERQFRYRKPLTCGANPEAHKVADLGHPYTRAMKEGGE